MDSKKWENIADTYSIIGMLPKVHSVKGFMYSNNRGTYKKNISNGVFIFCFLLEESFLILLYVYKKNRELKRQAEVTNQVKAIGNIGDWVYCSDTDVLTMSTLASDIIGLSGKATIGFDDLLKQVCRDDEEDFRMVWNKFIETGSLNHDLRIGELNSYNWINIRASKDLESSKNKYIGYFTDITEKKWSSKLISGFWRLFSMSVLRQ